MAHDGIFCSCGRRVRADAVVQHGFVMVKWEPVFVYLKYRCRHCGQIGEELVPCEEWHAELLPGAEEGLREPVEELPAADPIEELFPETFTPDDNPLNVPLLTDPEEAALALQLRTLTAEDWHELRNTI